MRGEGNPGLIRYQKEAFESAAKAVEFVPALQRCYRDLGAWHLSLSRLRLLIGPQD